MAHRCWALNEIVSCIAEILVSDEATASAVALARCARSFEGPALCEVWRNLSSLAPLVRCFPPEFWEVEVDEQLYFTRGPSCTEWTRFQQQYASKVRHLVVSSPNAVISSSALQMLQLYSHGGPLLPNLVSLDWDSDDSFLPFIMSFIPRSLRSITIDGQATGKQNLPPILARLPTMAPDISDIEALGLNCDPSIEEASSQLLMQCNPNRLRKFIIDARLSTSALSHIMQLPFLEQIWLEGPCHFPDPLPNVVFPSLQILYTQFREDLDWLRLLPQSPVLSAIHVRCPVIAPFMEKFQAITTECGMHERLEEFTVFSLFEFQITPKVISCNFSFKNLTLLRLSSHCGTHCQTQHLTDADIDLLADAMRGIQTLAIGGRPCYVSSKITFHSLYTLSRRCTRLTSLRIHFNPISFITKVYAGLNSRNGDFEIPSSELCSVRKVDVGKIALPRQLRVSDIMASALLGVFPRVEKVEYSNVAWKEVDEAIGFHRCVNTAFVRG